MYLTTHISPSCGKESMLKIYIIGKSRFRMLLNIRNVQEYTFRVILHMLGFQKF